MPGSSKTTITETKDKVQVTKEQYVCKPGPYGFQHCTSTKDVYTKKK